MSTDRSLELRVFALTGICLLSVQQAERAIARAVELVLKDRIERANRLIEQTEKQQKRILSHFLKELRNRAHIEPDFDQKLWHFVKMRNTLVHNLSEVPGWNPRTKKGREAAFKFLVELAMLSFALTGVFTSLLLVSAKDEFGVDMIEEDDDPVRQSLARLIEKQFGPTAHMILAAKKLLSST